MKKVFNLLYTNEKNKKNIIFVFILMYCCLTIFQSSSFFVDGAHHDAYNLIKVIKVFFLAGICLYSLIDVLKGKTKINLFLLLVALSFLITFILTRDSILLAFLMFVWALKQYRFDDFVKYALIFITITTVLIISLALFNIIPDLIIIRDSSTSRHTLGFNCAPYSQTLVMIITLMSVYIYKEKLSFFAIMIEFLASVFVYYLTISRADFFLTILILVFALVLKLISCLRSNNKEMGIKTPKWLVVIIVSIPIVLIAIYSVLTLLWGTQSDFIIRLNEIFSNRFKFTYNTIKQNGISLFGKSIFTKDIYGNYNGVDNAFFNRLCYSGIVNTVIMISAFCYMLYKSSRKNNLYLTFALLVILIDSFVGPTMFFFYYNIFAFSLMDMLQNQRDCRKVDDIELDALDLFYKQENLKLLNKLKLTIIVPVYNGEKYIDRAMELLLNQKVNKEIIVINDCSTDSTIKKFQKYKDDIILISNKTNLGVSAARNLGIKMATGDYITFFDIDDIIENDIYESMLYQIIKEKKDICVCLHDMVDEKGTFLKKSNYGPIYNDNDDPFILYLTNQISASMCDKIFSRVLIKSLTFDKSLSIGEDAEYCLRVFYKRPLCSFCNKVLYHYVQNKESATHSISEKSLEFLNICKTDFFTNIKKNVKDKDLLEYFELQMITRSIHSISSNYNSKQKKKAVELLKNICTKENLNKIIKDKHFPRSTRMECKVLKVFGVRFHLFLFPLYKMLKKFI